MKPGFLLIEGAFALAIFCAAVIAACRMMGEAHALILACSSTITNLTHIPSDRDMFCVSPHTCYLKSKTGAALVLTIPSYTIERRRITSHQESLYVHL